MKSQIEDFYLREDDFYLRYDREHSERIKKVVSHFHLGEIKSEKISDFGCGFGFLLKYLDKSNQLVGFDGAEVNKDKVLSEFTFEKENLNEDILKSNSKYESFFDHSICLETVEHLTSPYNCVLNMKRFTKPDGFIYISIPEIQVLHTVLYPGLFYPKQNFEVFLGQMALEIVDELFINKSCHVWKCINRDWTQKRMLFPKSEAQFFHQHPLEMVNS